MVCRRGSGEQKNVTGRQRLLLLWQTDMRGEQAAGRQIRGLHTYGERHVAADRPVLVTVTGRVFDAISCGDFESGDRSEHTRRPARTGSG